ncbi:hypothetical protein DLAC_03670 [Tieghemostelium lacteum]|uniref:Uncharacterized protein n=1 Tax=Tieghemostelium lacteum TaxID=361077 RepID=A0A152A0Y6_TIELA|nr:hypothetical protein DLAC_03670 [Tieghemostelium lacteum]|eukprot:KYQ99730.1 hypothetical protein DLAC_03670 [Tieghemostelium lacteum]
MGIYYSKTDKVVEEEKNQIHIPQYLILKTVNYVVNIDGLVGFRIDLLCRFVYRLSLVCKEWNNDIVPKIQIPSQILVTKYNITHLKFLLNMGILLDLCIEDTDNTLINQVEFEPNANITSMVLAT